jgi:23S rRNA pseudouridine2605 synthase
MSKKPFSRFIQQEEKGARKKERIRQEKKKLRQETKAYFEKKKAVARGAGIPKEPLTVQKKAGTEKSTPGKSASKGTPSSAGSAGPLIKKAKAEEDLMPLNKFIAHCGVCARREAAEWVKGGKVTVNNNRITSPGHRVSQRDDVRVNGKPVHLRHNLVYILLNKPKDCITTTDDPSGRTTVLDIVKKATTERVYPVGRLDRNTTGVLLLTNDGELAQKLAHPRFEVKKIYEVTLNKQLSNKDFDAIARGVVLEDGFIAPDALAWPSPNDKHIVGIEIHSGRNRIVRRIFEHFGYDIKGLDRVLYANLSKKNVERGKWRFLSEKEVRLLKYLNASYNK